MRGGGHRPDTPEPAIHRQSSLDLASPCKASRGIVLAGRRLHLEMSGEQVSIALEGKFHLVLLEPAPGAWCRHHRTARLVRNQRGGLHSCRGREPSRIPGAELTKARTGTVVAGRATRKQQLQPCCGSARAANKHRIRGRAHRIGLPRGRAREHPRHEQLKPVTTGCPAFRRRCVRPFARCP